MKMNDSITESSSLDTLLSSPPPEKLKGGGILVLAGVAAFSDSINNAIERIVSIRGILMVLAIAALITGSTKHMELLIATLGGSLVPQNEKVIKKK